jgi:hypothetical protein
MERAARLRGFFHDAFTRVFDALWAVSRRAWTKIAKTTPCKVERPPDCSTVQRASGHEKKNAIIAV